MPEVHACLIGKGPEMRFFPSAGKGLEEVGVEFDAITKIPGFWFAETTESGAFLESVIDPRYPQDLVATFRVGPQTVELLPGYGTAASKLEGPERYIRAHLEEIWRELVRTESAASHQPFAYKYVDPV